MTDNKVLPENVIFRGAGQRLLAAHEVEDRSTQARAARVRRDDGATGSRRERGARPEGAIETRA
jgi:hypothetical protein